MTWASLLTSNHEPLQEQISRNGKVLPNGQSKCVESPWGRLPAKRSLMTTLEAHLLYIDTSESTKTGASVTSSQGLGTYVLTVQHSTVRGSVFQYLMDPLDLNYSVPT